MNFIKNIISLLEVKSNRFKKSIELTGNGIEQICDLLGSIPKLQGEKETLQEENEALLLKLEEQKEAFVVMDKEYLSIQQNLLNELMDTKNKLIMEKGESVRVSQDLLSQSRKRKVTVIDNLYSVT